MFFTILSEKCIEKLFYFYQFIVLLTDLGRVMPIPSLYSRGRAESVLRTVRGFFVFFQGNGEARYLL